MADIEAMFHQVLVTPEHRDALRFLWWNNEHMSGPPATYRMKVHLFGGVWSPSCAAFALQRTFQDHGKYLHEEIQKASRNFYVDDLLHSVESPGKATIVIHRLRKLLNKGGFRLTKWSCNQKRVLKEVPQSEQAMGVKEILLGDKLPTERALGILWDLEEDELAVQVQIPKKPETKRGLLSMISSIYDPLGFLAPSVIRAKMIFQEECRRRTGWDEKLADKTMTAWRRWLTDLPYLTRIRVPRCYRHESTGSTTDVQLHHFSDASQHAYGVVSYLRMTNAEGAHQISLCVVRPSWPSETTDHTRLELCAAVLATRADKQIRKELDQRIDRTTFWTDSTAVLQYIRNTERRFHVFVANRISAIHEESNPEQWRHVTSSINPADDASRGLNGMELSRSSRWIRGPAFLSLDEDQWPRNDLEVPNLTDEDPEVKKETTVLATNVSQGQDILEKLWNRYSSWYRLLKGVAWIRRFLQWLVGKKDGSCHQGNRLLAREVEEARLAVLKCLQGKHFSQEIKTLKGTQCVKHGEMSRLEPHLGMDGLIRVGGRLTRAALQTDQRTPILLPREDRLTELIVQEIHATKTGHSGREYTLAALRENYWIPKCRRLLDRVLRSCVTCRRTNWTHTRQKEADLPEDRLLSGDRPFTYTGVDCFGPILVKQGRGPLRTRCDWHPGDIVLITDQPLPRSQWMLGRILEVIPSEDGFVRQVKVKTENSVLTRPVSKLCQLEGVHRNNAP
ncbi:uncharacterized protein LOC123518388 [Portunus trituberculatus]|uniref:uncharacterized protein LOC123518388 n=1 Tax=Portunus trituberculatus TaxID=210409 RepID=UPI001E1D108F|nr:uncharacterized protein LOC123518388 [Portunus trituberculatus]